MIIKCTMREGVTEADIEGHRYTFKLDADGNPLCSVTKEGHIKQLLAMGPHCYIEFTPPKPIEQMSAAEILALPDGEAEEEKARIKQEIERGAEIDAENAEKAKKASTEARLTELEKEKEADAAALARVQSTSPAANLAEARIAEIIKSFKTLSKDRFKSWIDMNRDQIPTMPPDVRDAIAKKFAKAWPGDDPEIEGVEIPKADDQLPDTTD